MNKTHYLLEHIDIEINHRCNLTCKHCSAQVRKGLCDDELSVEEIKKILTEAKTLSLKKVGLTGGEPLIDMAKLDDIANFCLDELNIPLHIHTNGTLVGKILSNNGKVLSNFESISVTFLGGNENIHDYMTSTKGSFKQAFEGAKLLAEKGLPLSCYFIPSHSTCESFKKLTPELKRIGVNRIRAMALAPSGRARPVYKKMVPHKDEINDFQKSLLDTGSDLNIKMEAGYCTRLSMSELSILGGHEKCMSGQNRLHINSKGDVFPCTAASGVQELCLGNLRENEYNLSEIWYNSKLINRIRQLKRNSLEECENCPRNPKCQFSCIVNAFGTMSNELRNICPLINLQIEINSK